MSANLPDISLIDESGDRKYFTVIPNYILNHSSAIERSLYIEMKRAAGEKGECFLTEKHYCENLGIGEKKLHQALKYLLDHKWISFVGRTRGKTRPVNTYKVNDIWKLNQEFYKKKIVVKSGISSEKEKDSRQKTDKIVVRSTPKEEPIEEEDNINTNVLIQGSPVTYGNEDINFLISYFKEKFHLPILDGSEKTNRRYCWLSLKKFKGVEKIKLLIETAAQDDFWSTKITSFQQLYYKGVQIISKTRGGANGESRLGIVTPDPSWQDTGEVAREIPDQTN